MISYSLYDLMVTQAVFIYHAQISTSTLAKLPPNPRSGMINLLIYNYLQHHYRAISPYNHQTTTCISIGYTSK